MSTTQIHHNINFREKKSKPRRDKRAEQGALEDGSAAKSRISRFRYFQDISGYSGVSEEANSSAFRVPLSGSNVCVRQVFICGPSPHWMLVTSRGALRLHPMIIDGAIESFSAFHNINCPKGFLYFNKQVNLVLLCLPQHQLAQRL